MLPKYHGSCRLCIILLLLPIAYLAGCSGKTEQTGSAGDSNASLPSPAAGPALPALPPAKDGFAVLANMVSAYKSANSLEEKTVADMAVSYMQPPEIHQENMVRYTKSPARVYLRSSDPVSGTHEFFADGVSLIHYSGLINEYIRRSVSGDLQAISNKIYSDTPQIMTPTTFLSSKTYPAGIGTARLIGQEQTDGHPAYRVTGTMSADYQRELSRRVFGKVLTPTDSSYTMWVDPANYLLRKFTIRLGWKGTLKGKDGKEHPFAPTLKITETLKNLVINPAFSDDVFRFQTPPGAKERFIEGKKDL